MIKVTSYKLQSSLREAPPAQPSANLALPQCNRRPSPPRRLIVAAPATSVRAVAAGEAAILRTTALSNCRLTWRTVYGLKVLSIVPGPVLMIPAERRLYSGQVSLRRRLPHVGGRLFQSGWGGPPAYALHWDVHDATRETSASRRTSLFPERENGQRLAS
jgi:hypothetical protein